MRCRCSCRSRRHCTGGCAHRSCLRIYSNCRRCHRSRRSLRSGSWCGLLCRSLRCRCCLRCDRCLRSGCSLGCNRCLGSRCSFGRNRCLGCRCCCRLLCRSLRCGGCLCRLCLLFHLGLCFLLRFGFCLLLCFLLRLRFCLLFRFFLHLFLGLFLCFLFGLAFRFLFCFLFCVTCRVCSVRVALCLLFLCADCTAYHNNDDYDECCAAANNIPNPIGEFVCRFINCQVECHDWVNVWCCKHQCAIVINCIVLDFVQQSVCSDHIELVFFDGIFKEEVDCQLNFSAGLDDGLAVHQAQLDDNLKVCKIICACLVQCIVDVRCKLVNCKPIFIECIAFNKLCDFCWCNLECWWNNGITNKFKSDIFWLDCSCLDCECAVVCADQYVVSIDLGWRLFICFNCNWDVVSVILFNVWWTAWQIYDCKCVVAGACDELAGSIAELNLEFLFINIVCINAILVLVAFCKVILEHNAQCFREKDFAIFVKFDDPWVDIEVGMDINNDCCGQHLEVECANIVIVVAKCAVCWCEDYFNLVVACIFNLWHKAFISAGENLVELECQCCWNQSLIFCENALEVALDFVSNCRWEILVLIVISYCVNADWDVWLFNCQLALECCWLCVCSHCLCECCNNDIFACVLHFCHEIFLCNRANVVFVINCHVGHIACNVDIADLWLTVVCDCCVVDWDSCKVCHDNFKLCCANCFKDIVGCCQLGCVNDCNIILSFFKLAWRKCICGHINIFCAVEELEYNCAFKCCDLVASVIANKSVVWEDCFGKWSKIHWLIAIFAIALDCADCQSLLCDDQFTCFECFVIYACAVNQLGISIWEFIVGCIATWKRCFVCACWCQAHSWCNHCRCCECAFKLNLVATVNDVALVAFDDNFLVANEVSDVHLICACIVAVCCCNCIKDCFDFCLLDCCTLDAVCCTLCCVVEVCKWAVLSCKSIVCECEHNLNIACFCTCKCCIVADCDIFTIVAHKSTGDNEVCASNTCEECCAVICLDECIGIEDVNSNLDCSGVDLAYCITEDWNCDCFLACDVCAFLEQIVSLSWNCIFVNIVWHINGIFDLVEFLFCQLIDVFCGKCIVVHSADRSDSAKIGDFCESVNFCCACKDGIVVWNACDCVAQFYAVECCKLDAWHASVLVIDVCIGITTCQHIDWIAFAIACALAYKIKCYVCNVKACCAVICLCSNCCWHNHRCRNNCLLCIPCPLTAELIVWCNIFASCIFKSADGDCNLLCANVCCLEVCINDESHERDIFCNNAHFFCDSCCDLCGSCAVIHLVMDCDCIGLCDCSLCHRSNAQAFKFHLACKSHRL